MSEKFGEKPIFQSPEPNESSASGKKEEMEKIESIETKLDLEAQYEVQMTILKNVGVVEKLSDGTEGIRDINGKEHPAPTYEDIKQRVAEKREVLDSKVEQGFTKLLIVPYGMSLDALQEKYKEILWKHYQEKNLFVSNPGGRDFRGRLEDTPKGEELPFELAMMDKLSSGEIHYEDVWKQRDDIMDVSDRYRGADKDGRLVYYPDRFQRFLKPVTKDELVSSSTWQTKEQVINKRGAWSIVLFEDTSHAPPHLSPDFSNILRDGISGQRHIRPSALDYMNRLGTQWQDGPSYSGQKWSEDCRHEQGITPEDYLTAAIINLEENNRVLGSHRGPYSRAPVLALGAYFPPTESSDIQEKEERYGRSTRMPMSYGRVPEMGWEDGFIMATHEIDNRRTDKIGRDYQAPTRMAQSVVPI